MVQNGTFIAANEGGAAEEFGTTLDRFFSNSGQVSRFETIVLPGNLKAANPFLAERLDANGGTATLDAAEYQALLESNGLINNDLVLSRDSRDVVLGTDNQVGGNAIRFLEANNADDSNSNTWVVNGRQVETNFSQLTCVAVGDQLHFIRSGGVRFWQEEDRAPDWWALPDPRINLPEGGRSWRFSRTLLGAGERPDVTLNLNFK